MLYYIAKQAIEIKKAKQSKPKGKSYQNFIALKQQF